MISANLKFLRTRLGFSQEELSEKIGVSRQTIAKWENGETLPDVMKCAELARLYDVSLEAMVSCSLDETMIDDDNSNEGKYAFGIVKVGERGQVVIPKQARIVYDIKAGDKLLVVGDGRGMAFAKLKGLSPFNFNR